MTKLSRRNTLQIQLFENCRTLNTPMCRWRNCRSTVTVALLSGRSPFLLQVFQNLMNIYFSVWSLELESDIDLNKVGLEILYAQVITEVNLGWIIVPDKARRNRISQLTDRKAQKEVSSAHESYVVR